MSLRRLLALTIIILSMSAGASAQVPAAIGRLFNGPYRSSPAATETIITGEPLKPYDLTLFHSLMITDDSQASSALEKAVKADGKEALWEETESVGGRLRYAIYELRGKQKRRYILYLNTFPSGGNEATVIYLEGKATPSQIKRLITTISK